MRRRLRSDRADCQACRTTLLFRPIVCPETLIMNRQQALLLNVGVVETQLICGDPRRRGGMLLQQLSQQSTSKFTAGTAQPA